MPASYPLPITYQDFQTGSLSTANPTLRLDKPQSGIIACSRMEEIKEKPRTCAALEVKLQVEDGPTSTLVFKKSDGQHNDLASDDIRRFCFAPDHDEANIIWRHQHPEHIQASVLSLHFRSGTRLVRIWQKTFTWTNCPERGVTRFKGNLALDDQGFDLENNPGLASVELDYKGTDHFPLDSITIAGSPYLLTLAVIPRSGATATESLVYTYFDVLIGGIELQFCPDDLVERVLPQTNKARDLAVFRSLTDATDADNLNGALPQPGALKKVYLRSHAFYKDTSELTNHAYFERFRALWGDGPNIPIFAKVKVLDASRNPVHAPTAVGKLRFLWEWLDKGDRPWPGGDVNTKAWLDATRDYKAAATADSPAGRNCHVDRGGKRGPNAKTCFPAQAGVAPVGELPQHNGSDAVFPFKVSPCNAQGSPFATNRRWCAFSESWPSGALAGKTGVLFQPSRMSGDGYELHVYMAYTSDAELETQVTPVNVAPAVHTASGTFQSWRELEILKHWRMKTVSVTGALLDLAAVRTRFKNYYINLKIPPNHSEALGNWFNQLQAVCTGNALPDHIREAIDHTKHDVLLYFKSYETWLARMRVLHGPGDDALYHWANNVPNYLDTSGNLVQSSWELYDGNNGITPLMKPWPLQCAPVTSDEGDGVVVVRFQPTNKPAEELRLEFAERTIGHRSDSVTPTMTQQLRDALARLMIAHIQGIGEGNFCSYQHSRAPHRLHHAALSIALRGRTTKARHRNRMTNIRLALEAANQALFQEKSKTYFESSIAKLGWGFIVFNATIDAALTAEFAARGGIVAIQGTDLSNLKLPTGKAFYANAAGDRALAACLAMDPAQVTFEHEIGHALFLNHTYHSQAPNDPNFYHTLQSPTGGPCIMYVTPSNGCTPNSQFCGFCLVRLWGWSALTYDPVNATTQAPRTLWYDPEYNRDPGAPGLVPPLPTDPLQLHPVDIVV